MNKKLKAVLILVMDVLLIGVCLIVFALFHHVLPQKVEMNTSYPVNTRRPTVTPAVTVTASPDGSSGIDVTPTPYIDYGQFGEKFMDKFATDDTVIHTENEYKSKDIYLSISHGSTDYGSGLVVYHVIDIYLRNVDNLRTKLANDSFGKGYKDDVRKLTFEMNGIVGLSGDMSSATRGGIVIRNGQVYSDKKYNDVCVLYWDGTVRTFDKDTFDMDQAMQDGAYQAWDFGPRLLDDNGEVLTKFNTTNYIAAKHPRSCFGYYEPSHYCFVTIDGRECSNSVGTNMKQTARLMKDLGCTLAFNLDGGESAVMVHNNFDGDWKNDFVNVPYQNGRDLSDIIYIAEMENINYQQ